MVNNNVSRDAVIWTGEADSMLALGLTMVGSGLTMCGAAVGLWVGHRLGFRARQEQLAIAAPTAELVELPEGVGDWVPLGRAEIPGWGDGRHESGLIAATPLSYQGRHARGWFTGEFEAITARLRSEGVLTRA
jgi:hypothetical protein